jgi:hypothetical protein
MTQEWLASSGRAESPLKLCKEYGIRLDGSDTPSESRHARGGIPDAGAYFQNALDIPFAQPLKNLGRCRSAARMQVSHAQPGAKLMILKQGDTSWRGRLSTRCTVWRTPPSAS